jgi:hypothetical protein
MFDFFLFQKNHPTKYFRKKYSKNSFKKTLGEKIIQENFRKNIPKNHSRKL